MIREMLVKSLNSKQLRQVHIQTCWKDLPLILLVEDHENKITGVTDSNRVYEITVEITLNR